MLRASSGYNIVQKELANEFAPRDTGTKQAGEGVTSEVPHDFTDIRLSDLQSKHTLLRQEYELHGTQYRRWTIGAVENARLFFEKEEDLAAERDKISELNNTINAWLGAQLAFTRRIDQYNQNLLKQALRRSSLTPDIIDPLFADPEFIQRLQPRPASGDIGPSRCLLQPGSAQYPTPNPAHRDLATV